MGKFQKKYYDILKSIYPNFERDFNEEYSKQRLAMELIKLRLESNSTQEEYEMKTGIKQSYLSLLENASTNPQFSTIIKIAQNNGYRVVMNFKKEK